MSSDKIWKFINREQVYDGDPYIKIFKDTVELPAGKIIDDYHRIEVNNAVMLLIENENKELLVYNEYRHGIGEVSFTFPAGGIEENENLEEASRREVSGSYMFAELNMILIKDIKKISEPKEVDIENPEILWLPRKLVLDGIYNEKFKGLTYATAALIWLLYQDER